MNKAKQDSADNVSHTVEICSKNIAEHRYPYKFSIITPVYNVENILKETIESVLNQDLVFKKNVQLILVNDGSPDKSGEICDEYAQQYPDNIIVIHKKNGGVASARNAGLKYATGKYLNFLDSDDKFACDVLQKVYSFFQKHYDETDVVTIPVHFFDGASGSHWQNWKFENGSRVINLRGDYQNPCMRVNSSFFKNERKNEIEFDPRLADAEDAKVVLGQVFPKLTLGVLSDTRYEYRVINNGASLVQTSTGKREWYLNFIPYLLQWAHNFYVEKLGYFPAFAQCTLLCIYQWRLITQYNPSIVLSEEEVREYKQHLYDALKLFDDQHILEQEKICLEHKFFMIAQKYGSELKKIPTKNDRLFCIHNTELFRESSAICVINFFSIKNKRFFIEGFVRMFSLDAPDDIKVFLKVNGEFHLCEIAEKDYSEYFLGDLLSPAVGFQSSFLLGELNTDYTIEIYVEINGLHIIKNNLYFSQFCPIQNFLINGYFYNDGRALTCRNGVFYISACSQKERLRREVHLLKVLWGIKEHAAKRAVFMRILHYVTTPFQRKTRWIISDRINKAGDNGEALFSYMSQNKDNDVKSCFAISKNSPDYKRLKKTGAVIPLQGWRYKLYCLQGAYIISSHIDDSSRFPFKDNLKYYADLFHKTKFIFLQHGITKDNLSNWLKRDNKNINLFITATQPEYRSILEYDYDYTAKQVKLTGFPRYDLLTHNEKKSITVMPTWRKYLMSNMDAKTGLWKFQGDFRQSKFYLFYHSLLNNEQLMKTAKKHGYTFRFMLHPGFDAGSEMMHFSDRVKLLDASTSYRKIFAESDMIVTDYSSVAFDFAYLRKPLIYCHFDAAEVFSGKHVYTRGYFDYERDGFGEVVYDLDSAVQHIIEYMQNGCKLKDKYLQRIENTFTFNDRNNCERVYQAIKSLDRE